MDRRENPQLKHKKTDWQVDMINTAEHDRVFQNGHVILHFY